MGENKSTVTESIIQNEKSNVVFVPYKSEKEQKVICEVCGHANPENTAICKKCSNYLL